MNYERQACQESFSLYRLNVWNENTFFNKATQFYKLIIYCAFDSEKGLKDKQYLNVQLIWRTITLVYVKKVDKQRWVETLTLFIKLNFLPIFTVFTDFTGKFDLFTILQVNFKHGKSSTLVRKGNSYTYVGRTNISLH